jgi:glucose/mannose-6-phosphate isomerase
MFDMNDARALSARDSQGMLGHILGLPDQIQAAWRLVQGVELPREYRDVDAVVVLGMGGSAIGGDLVRTVVGHELRVPLTVVRDYELPGFVSASTLVVASSHSGATEETLSGVEAALARGAKVLAISSGGKLVERVGASGRPTVRFTYVSQPRAAVGYSTLLLLGVLDRLGLVSPKGEDVAETVILLRTMAGELGPDVPLERNPAKDLALFIQGKVPVIYGGFLAEVARRWKGQFNENAKTSAFFEAFPELDHNAVVGYQDPGNLRGGLAFVMLASDYDYPRTRLRLEVTGELMERYGVSYRRVAARGRSRLAQVFSAAYVADFASFYLAALYAVDPTPIEPIDHLKAELASRG